MALFHQCPDIARQILSCKKISAMHALCKRFKTIPTWYENRDRIMKETISLKVDAIKPLIVRELHEHEGKILVQPSIDRADRYWGCGLNKDMAEIVSPAEFPGLNQLGAFWERMSNDIDFMNS